VDTGEYHLFTTSLKKPDEENIRWEGYQIKKSTFHKTTHNLDIPHNENQLAGYNFKYFC
jgi:hypothetical protein